MWKNGRTFLMTVMWMRMVSQLHYISIWWSGSMSHFNTSTIGNIIGVPQQYVSPIKQKIKAGRSYRADIGGALLYLTHRNAPEKHQYSDDQVVAKGWLRLDSRAGKK